MFKRVLRRLLLGLVWPFSLLRPLFCWWVPIRFGSIGHAVLMPDSLVIWMVFFAGVWLLPYLGWKFIPAFCAILIVAPGVSLTLVWVSDSRVLVVRLVACIPYRWNRIPDNATFDLYEAWEDPAPTGVAFEYKSAKTVHFGTVRSAESLYAHVGGLLESVGWKQTSLGYRRPTGNAVDP